MITVRFSNGQAVQYNDATYVSRHTDYSDLLTKKDGHWIAQVPNTCIIEIRSACRVYNGMAAESDQRIEMLAKEIRSLKRKIK